MRNNSQNINLTPISDTVAPAPVPFPEASQVTPTTKQPQPVRPAWGVALLLYGLIALASTPLTFMFALLGQIYDGPPDSKPIAISILSIIFWLAPFSSIASGITGLMASVFVFTEHRIPAILNVLLVLFITIPAAILLFGFLILTFS